MFITIAIGIGLASFGFFILLFLFKFLFKQHKTDRSHLIEISIQEEPRLFSFIQEIVNEVGTNFPKRIYLSADVNAGVFYDSNFWSMIFPVRKNLQIGLSLINTVSQQEFKAILAHEFGHFSQRSMKVGSYVYNVNQIIFNMLYDNDSFDNMTQKWASISGYFSIFVLIAQLLIKGIQWILRKIYAFVNINYMALSREMEFHADEIAANVAGYLPLKESLLRLGLAEHSYNEVLAFYENKIPDCVKSKNIYKEQEFVMNFLATRNQLSFKNNLPMVSELDLNRYNKSKLIIKNQWASHPDTEERIKALELTNIHKEGNEDPAILLFDDPERIQEQITERIFSSINYAETPKSLDLATFKADYLYTYNQNSFPNAYNGYYDNKGPFEFDVNAIQDFNISETMDTLFGKEKVDLVYVHLAYENDKSVLTEISNGETDIKTFDYEGQKYKLNEAGNIIAKIEESQNIVRERIKENDINIYRFFYHAGSKNGNNAILKEKYLDFFKLDSNYDTRSALYSNMNKATSFMNVKTPFKKIRKNLQELLPLEEEFKSDIKRLLEDESLKNEMPEHSRENFEKYLFREWEYFDNDAYIDANLQILFKAKYDYIYLISRQYFLTKSDLLNFQISLLEK